jgi:hypothetical protein
LVSTSRSVAQDPARVDQPRDRVAELDLRIAHAVAAQQRAARLAQLVEPSLHDLACPLGREVPLREGRDRERGERLSAHRVDVGERVGRGDLAERVGIVHHRREEVDGLDQRARLVQPEHTGVVAGPMVDQHPGVVVLGQAAQDLSQLGRAELAGSTRAGHPLGQAPDPLALVAHLHYIK